MCITEPFFLRGKKEVSDLISALTSKGEIWREQSYQHSYLERRSWRWAILSALPWQQSLRSECSGFLLPSMGCNTSINTPINTPKSWHFCVYKSRRLSYKSGIFYLKKTNETINTSTFHPTSVWLTNAVMKKQYYKTCQIKKNNKKKELEYNITITIWYVQAL